MVRTISLLFLAVVLVPWSVAAEEPGMVPEWQKPVRSGTFSIRLSEAAIKEVEFAKRPGRLEVQRFKGLAVRVEVSFLEQGKIEGSNKPVNVPVKLTDDQGRVIGQPLAVSLGKTVHDTASRLPSKDKPAVEVLLFKTPQPGAKFYQLEIDSRRYGSLQPETLKFKIPAGDVTTKGEQPK